MNTYGEEQWPTEGGGLGVQTPLLNTKLQLSPEPLTASISPFSLSSAEFVEHPPPPNKIPGYATGEEGTFKLVSSQP
jgi:hypothetical protein